MAIVDWSTVISTRL